MFSIRKRKQDMQNFVNVERKESLPKIENCIEIHLESWDVDINKIIYQKLREEHSKLRT
jgi:uncharacterized protein YdhG (YjbR/CyaY superfamily)